MYMLRDVFRQLDEWIARENADARAQGLPTDKACQVRVLGQTALLEAKVSLSLAATQDVDVYATWSSKVERHFAGLLRREGKHLDPLGHGRMPAFGHCDMVNHGRCAQNPDPGNQLVQSTPTLVLVREF